MSRACRSRLPAGSSRPAGDARASHSEAATVYRGHDGVERGICFERREFKKREREFFLCMFFRSDRFLQNWPQHRNGVVPKPAGHRPLGHHLGGDGMGGGKIGVLTAAHFGS